MKSQVQILSPRPSTQQLRTCCIRATPALPACSIQSRFLRPSPPTVGGSTPRTRPGSPPAPFPFLAWQPVRRLRNAQTGPRGRSHRCTDLLFPPIPRVRCALISTTIAPPVHHGSFRRTASPRANTLSSTELILDCRKRRTQERIQQPAEAHPFRQKSSAKETGRPACRQRALSQI